MPFNKKSVFAYVTCTTFGLLAGGGRLSPAVADCLISFNTPCQIDNGRSVTLENVDIVADNIGVDIWNTSHLSMKGGSIHSTKGNALWIYGSGSATFDGTQINSFHDAINIDQGLFSNPDANHPAQLIMKGGFAIHTESKGAMVIRASGLLDIDLKDGMITTAGSGTTAIMLHGHVHDKAEDAHGQKPARLHAENLDIVMQGKSGDGHESTGFHLTNTKGSLKNINISIDHDFSTGLYASSSQIDMTGSTINVGHGHGAVADHNSILNLDGVTINQTDQERFNYGYGIDASNQSHVTFKNGVINLAGYDNFGFITDNSTLAIENSQINLHGQDGYGLYFVNNKGKHTTRIDNSRLQANELLALWSYDSTDHVDLTNSIVDANHLVHVASHQEASSFTLNTKNSQLVGHASLDDQSQLSINLEKGSRWTLRPSKENFFGDFIKVAPNRSNTSFLQLQDSQIVFDSNGSNLYQTLTVGSGNVEGRKDVFTSGGNASISFNTFADEDGSLDPNKTDRLIINGDVSGITSVTIKAITGSQQGTSKTNGISLIQVSGHANEDSFQLKGGYTTMGGKPYQYVLKAYGSQSKKDTAAHWDYRLQRKLASTGNGDTFWQVAPQVASYLVAPTALFQSQFMDIAHLTKHLDALQVQSATDSDDNHSEFFLHAHGGDFDYQSNLTAAQYGYDADIQYKAMQAGGNLYTYEKLNHLWRFGLAGSYGDLTYQPKNVEGSQATSMQVGRLTPYLSWQHDSGMHANMLLSYGRFNGYISTEQRGRTARLQGHSMAASMTMGRTFTLSTSHNNLDLEPQLQLTYQKLEFGQESDIDDFEVALGNPERLTVQAGFKLQQHFTDATIHGKVKPYASLHIRHAIKDDNKVWLGDNFALGRAGTVLELGSGLQASLFSNIHLNGAVNWQKNIGHAGLSGLYFNADLRGNF